MVPGQVHVQPERLNASMRPGLHPVLGYTVAAVCCGMGVALLAGVFPLATARPASVMVGVILILLGLNRFLLTRYKSKPRRRRWLDRGRDE